MHCDLSGQTALITGGSGSLGRVISLALAEAGADVAVHYHQNQTQADELVQTICGMGRRAMAVQAELAQRDAVQSMRNTVTAEWGHVSILIANAVSQVDPWQPLIEQDPADYLDQFNSCVMQNVHLAQAFIPAMIERGHGGRYVALSTECVMQNTPTQSAYVSGKRGLDGALRSLCREVAPHHITVNQVAPGWTISDRDPAGKNDAEYIESVPMKRRGTAREIADAVVFLASPRASFITGAWLPVCGGNVLPSI